MYYQLPVKKFYSLFPDRAEAKVARFARQLKAIAIEEKLTPEQYAEAIAASMEYDVEAVDAIKIKPSRRVADKVYAMLEIIPLAA
ncbi:MAG: hypothetical protein ACRC11_19725 [Xenococcaceae cyanobacterium]